MMPSSLVPRPKRDPVLWLTEHQGIVLAALTVIYGLLAASAAARKPFWFDEISTVYLSELRSPRDIWNAIYQGAELSPPLCFWSTWALQKVLGTGHVASRIPAMCGFWLMCVSLFFFVRRRSNAVHGLLALILPFLTSTSEYWVEARGYGMVLGFSAAALLFWQRTGDGGRFLDLAGLTLSLVVALGCHYYAAYLVAVLCLGEAIRSWERRRVHYGVWLAIAAGGASVLAYLPLILQNRRWAAPIWAAPTSSSLFASYSNLVAPGAILVLGVLAVSFLGAPRSDSEGGGWLPSPMPLSELAVCVALLAMPVSVFSAAVLVKLAFWPKYVMPSVIGYVILSALFVYRVGGRGAWLVARILTVALFVWFVPWAAWRAWVLVAHPGPEVTAAKETLSPAPPDLPVVYSDDQDFTKMQYYLRGAPRERIVKLIDYRAAVKYMGFDQSERMLDVAGRVRPIPLRPYQEFVRQHRDFLLVRTSPSGWLMQALLADGAELRLVEAFRRPGSTGSDTLVFLVRMPEKAP
jgi:NADH:ubiquinone oxidoreductase subunit 6 (subunit J)